MRLYPLALVAGLLPLMTIHCCYLWAVVEKHVPACIPYFQSCTTISSAGRTAPEFYLFKGLMIPAAVIIFAFWCCAGAWLRALGWVKTGTRWIIFCVTLVACVGLVWYSVMLGAIDDEFQTQRRIGVVLFFSLSFTAQVLFVIALTKINIVREKLPTYLFGLKVCLASILSFAISAVVISSIDSGVYDKIEDAFEWWVTFLLCLFPLLIAGMWRKTDYKFVAGVRL